MKYFTIDNWIADQDLSLDPPPSHLAARDYGRYLESVKERLPKEYLQLLDDWYLHDSNVTSVDIDHVSRFARLRLASSKHDRSPGFLTITYRGITRVRAESDSEKGLPGPHGFGDIGYDEIEVLDDELFEHRMLFSNGIELRFVFRSFEYADDNGA